MSAYVGNPTNPANGNKYQIETEYSGPNGLIFVRYYNSRLSTGPYASSAPKGFGATWRSTYERSIQFSDSISVPTVYANRPEGRTLHFVFANGDFKADADVADGIVRLTDGGGNPIGWQYTVAKTEEKETYDADGKLLKLTSRTGVEFTLSYDTAGRVTSVTDSFGRSLAFGYTNEALTSFTDPEGKSYSYTYDALGNVASVTHPDNRSRTYIYNESANTGGANRPHALTGIIDENGSRYATYKYAGDSVTSTEHAGSVNKYSFVYGTNKTTVTDPLLQQRVFQFANMHGVARNTSTTVPCGTGCTPMVESRAYDADANVIARSDFNGNKACFAYDTARNLETVRLEGLAASLSCPANLTSYSPTVGTRERKIMTQWHATYRQPTQIDEPGKRTTFIHDANGNVLTRTELDTATSTLRTWTYSYNSFGKVLTANGPRTDVSDVTTYTYYTCTTGFHCGQVHTITNALGHTTTYNTYNAHGQPLTITDPNGVVTTLTYDLRQRLTSRTVGSEATTFEYWPTGLLKKATLPDASYLSYIYDAAHRLTEIEDSEANRIAYTLDAMGNRTQEELFDPSGALTQTRSRVFDTLNRLQEEIGAAGTANVTTTFGYDNNGNQTSVAAPLGRDTSQGYDELNRLTQVTDPLSGITHYGYNALDQLISVTDPKGLATSYAYNALGDLEQQTSPDTGVTVNTYDTGGNLKTSTDARNAITTYTYDTLNRVTSAAFAVGSTTDQTLTYSYDAGTYGKGTLTGASDSNHALSWTYDDQGRLLTAGQTVGTVSKTTSYAYANGQRQSMTTPSGQLITYGYTNGKVTSISVNGTVLVSNILYDPFGPVRQWTWGNGTLSVRTFDQDGKITQMDSGGLKTYTYDDAFRITGITDITNAALSWTYGYDDLDRLTSASKTGTTLGYSYDANGNRLMQTGLSASTFAVAANSNRLSSTSGALARTYGYDNAGNTTSFTGITFAYNNRGRMKSSTKSGVTTSYTYNALGQLIKKGSNALYYYDDAGHILGIYNGSGALTEEIIWLGDIPIVTLRPKVGGGINIYNIHTDHLNTPRLVTGSVNLGARWRWDADPFGVGVPNNNPTGVGTFEFNLRFPGQIYFAETGLNYNYFRDYDPATGRYVQSDPIGLGGGINTYSYVGGNPVSYTDPLGLDAAAPAIPRPVPMPGVRPIPGWVRPPSPWWFLIYPIPVGDSDLGYQSRADGEPKFPPVNPGRDCNGKCNPCPPGKEWTVDSPGHGHPGGFRHKIVYNQDPVTCMCYPDRPSRGLQGK